MYDMYPWDSASQGDYPPQPLRSVRNPARRAPKPRDGSASNGSTSNGSARNGSALNGHTRDITAAQAVQIALDRRDNGGDAATPPAATAPAATPPAATAPAATLPAATAPAVRPAIQAVTRPAASQGRQ